MEKFITMGWETFLLSKHIPIVASRIGQQPIVNQPLLAISNKSELLVFPNPTTGLLTIRLSDQELKLSQIEIYNSMGDLVISKQIENNNYLLDMTPYNQGIYFIRGMDESKKYYTKSFNLLK
ncbi:MAG: T9SS type A sorting domain-containing protein [Bacteroidetes bacterium]|nr:T9SS type A sorting domain-containing protein [Bacteroidota bacterium]